MSAARHHLLRPAAWAPTAVLAVLAVVAAVLPTVASPALRHADFHDGTPIGHVDAMTDRPGGLTLRGWVIDPSVPSRADTVLVTIDGAYANSVVASAARPDVAKVYPTAGPNHGFSAVQLVPEGRHTVCLTGANTGAGTTLALGCTTRTFDYGPLGAVETVETRPGHLHVKGWAVDKDAITSPVVVDVAVDGVVATTSANRVRPTAPVAGGGTKHGIDVTLPAMQGTHTVCVTARNLGTYGTANRLAPCATITLDDRPLGRFDSASQVGPGLRVRGWGFDRDRPTTALTATVRVDGTAPRTLTASRSRPDVAAVYPGTGSTHGFEATLAAAEGTHTVCVTLTNLGYGSDRVLPCRTVVVTHRPTAAVTSLTATTTGLAVKGWATDPDTTTALTVHVSLDGRLVRTLTANAAGTPYSGRNFGVALPTTSGRHTVCATALNAGLGTAASPPACRTIDLALSPLGAFDSVTRSGSGLVVSGWALDPDTTSPVTVTYTVDGATAGSAAANVVRSDVGAVYPASGSAHGFRSVLAATDAEHTVCVTVRNVGGGADKPLGCKVVIAVDPTPPSAVLSVSATTTYGQATVRWTPPASDGGAPWSSYVVTASGGPSVTVPATATSATVTGLRSGGTYTFTVVARNVAGSSPATTSAAVTVPTGPAPQTKPAPISTSRYLRNIRTCTSSEAAVLRQSGATDAANNPSGHKYLMLLDIGGQSQTYGGVVLSATTRFVTYSALLTCSKAYVDGYAGAQKATAPAVIAIGVNNDMDVNTQTGRDWATNIVNPLVSYAKKYANITVAGANDIEPGFSASPAATRNWVSGYLAATSAPFVFNGSADGCAWTVANRSCNNGWTMRALYDLAAGLAPTRIVNLPQVYNYTMADQWKYISLTGIAAGRPRINFGGPLTEYTACVQAGSCGSIGGVAAWNRMWSNLQSTPSLKVTSLPYATDLRIDR